MSIYIYIYIYIYIHIIILSLLWSTFYPTVILAKIKHIDYLQKSYTVQIQENTIWYISNMR